MAGECVMLVGLAVWDTALVDTAAAHMPLPLMAQLQLQLGDNTKFVQLVWPECSWSA